MIEYIALGFATIFLVCVFWYLVQFWKYGHLEQIKGPTPLPFLGNFLRLINNNYIVDNLVDLIKEYGSVVKVWIGSDCYLIIADAELAEMTLKDSKIAFKDETFYKHFRRWFGQDGLFLANGEYGLKMRTVAKSMFHKDTIRGKFENMSYHCNIFNRKLSKLIQKSQPIDIKSILQELIFDIVMDVGCGWKTEAQENVQDASYIRALNFLIPNASTRMLSIWKRYDFLYRFSNDYSKETEAVKIINETATRIMTERRRKIDDGTVTFMKTEGTNKNHYQYFIDVALEETFEGRPLTVPEIFHFINGALVAATDAPSTTVSFLIYELGQNQIVQNKLLEEIEEVFGTDNKLECNFVNINQLKYMDLVIKEVLRYHSPIPFIARRLTEDLKFRGTTIPKDTGLIYCMKGFHESEEYYPNPEKFDPERFLDNDKFNQYAFLSFSAGDRNCMGMKIGWIMMKTILVYLLKSFKFTSAGPEYKIKPIVNMSLSSENGFHVNVTNRV